MEAKKKITLVYELALPVFGKAVSIIEKGGDAGIHKERLAFVLMFTDITSGLYSEECTIKQSASYYISKYNWRLLRSEVNEFFEGLVANNLID